MRKLETIVEILDNFILNNEMSKEGLDYIKSYISASCSKYYMDENIVISDFLVDAKERYDPNNPFPKKCVWIRTTISWLIKKKLDIAANENKYLNLLYDAEEPISNSYQEMVDGVNLQFIDKLLKNSFTDLEWDIYKNVLLGTDTQVEVAKRHWVSDERVSKKVKIVKDKIKKTLEF